MSPNLQWLPYNNASLTTGEGMSESGPLLRAVGGDSTNELIGATTTGSNSTVEVLPEENDSHISDIGAGDIENHPHPQDREIRSLLPSNNNVEAGKEGGVMISGTTGSDSTSSILLQNSRGSSSSSSSGGGGGSIGTDGDIENNNLQDRLLLPPAGDEDVDWSRHSITFEQLEEVEVVAKQVFGDNGYPTKTMNDIVKFVTGPLEDDGKSYALTKNPQNGIRMDAFVTHCWEEPFQDFVNSIRDAFASYPRGRKPNLWICAFALEQSSQQIIQDQIGDSLDDCPFVQALKRAKYFVVVRNTVRDLYERSWCVCELMYAKQEGFTATTAETSKITMVIGPNTFSNSSSRCADAKATNYSDQEKISQALHGREKEIDALIREYRKHYAPPKPPDVTPERVRSGYLRNFFLLQLIAVGCWVLYPYVWPTPHPPNASDFIKDLIRNGDPAKVTRLHFENLEYGGTIPTEIGLLTNLLFLRSRDNDWSGPIPSQMGLLTSLTELELASNHLCGPLPSELARLTRLENLNLQYNELTGSVPEEIAQLTKLESFILEYNQLTGRIATGLGKLGRLAELLLSHNALSGPIPTELAKLTSLTKLSLGENRITGTIPRELGRLTKLRSLWLYDCKLSGTIPSELAELTSLSQRLVLRGNMLSGPIPSELALLSNLQDLSLHHNRLTGTIPSELFQLSNLIYMGLNGNLVTGQHPENVCRLAPFTIYCDEAGFSCGGNCICW